jgi:hypothetical protein
MPVPALESVAIGRAEDGERDVGLGDAHARTCYSVRERGRPPSATLADSAAVTDVATTRYADLMSDEPRLVQFCDRMSQFSRHIWFDMRGFGASDGVTVGGWEENIVDDAEAIRSFDLDALSSAVPLNVDLDVVVSVLAGTVCAVQRRRLGTGYANATPDTLQRRFLHTAGTIHNNGDTITVRPNRRTYSPVLRSAYIPDTTVPWWAGRTLHFDYA